MPKGVPKGALQNGTTMGIQRNTAVDALVAKGFRLGKDLAFYVDKGAIHNEDAWAGRMGMILMYLFPAK